MKLLLGGSPCTYWSIEQTKNRETEPEGLGWELFKNYLIVLEKFKPDFFLYENNKSMALAIRAQITAELGVAPILINSALVSAQNRQRLYWTNIPGVEQPEDRGILLRDILESGLHLREKAYTLRASIGAHGGTSSVLKTIKEPGKFSFNGVAEPVRVGGMPNAAGEISGSQSGRIYSVDGKGTPLQVAGHTSCASTGLYAVPAGMALRGRGDGSAYEVRDDQKANAVTADGHQSRLVVDEVAIFQNGHGFNVGGIKYGKTPTLTANGDWPHNNFVIEAADGKTYPVYEVKGGQITINGKQYPIKLADGFYIIRKLTVTECKRLQTVPEEYIFPVSDTQAYKMLGNGWTVDVIAHILNYAPGITEELLEVLSMYDGMSCGHLALDKLGAHIAHYYATEIDKYAVQTTQHNFPDTIQLGNAFQVRDDGWSLPGMVMEETVATPAEEAVEEPEQDGGHVAAPSIMAGRTRECVLSLSYGKDSLACLGAIEELGWPLDRIIHAEVWATDTIPADLPPMVEFKRRADAVIMERWGIKVEHYHATNIDGEKKEKVTYQDGFYHILKSGKNKGTIKGFPMLRGPWCQKLKLDPFKSIERGSGGAVQYLGIAVDEPGRFSVLSAVKRSPLVEAGWTEAMCREWCEENGLLSPIYTDSARGGCWFCHNQSVKQLRLLRKRYPEYWALLLKWDKDSPVTFHADGHTVHDFDRRFQMEDDHLISADDKVFRWSMLDKKLNYRP